MVENENYVNILIKTILLENLKEVKNLKNNIIKNLNRLRIIIIIKKLKYINLKNIKTNTNTNINISTNISTNNVHFYKATEILVFQLHRFYYLIDLELKLHLLLH